ncbi:MAG: imidazole glycerol phosphate synthase subunit HisH [Verrucomicrobiota bacterium]
MTTIVDFGLGNLGSIGNMLSRFGEPSRTSRNSEEILGADRLILPGIGAFDEGMNKLRELGLVETLTTAVMEEKIPILGICLGFQMMTRRSDEGSSEGLGWLDGETLSLKTMAENASLRVPHMGWNVVDVVGAAPLFEGMMNDARFYFVHSFGVSPTLPDAQQWGKSRFENVDFISSAGKDHIMGVQFHPEKSHRYGLQLLKNFSSISKAP